jgi:hypothetical protein
VLIFGDSRCSPLGSLDTATNAFGSVGEVARSISKRYAFINASDPGESFTAISVGFTKRQHLVNWTSHVIVSLGINDFTAGKTSANCLAYLVTICSGLLAGKSVYTCTVAPKSASTDSWATTVNQTADATSNAARISYNTTMRTSPPPYISGVFEVADQIESSRDSGLWKVSGAAFGYTADGLHENSNGFTQIELSGIFSDVVF